jgi:predicted ATPase
MDQTREPWVIEEIGRRDGDRVLVRFRHELGYELVALARSPVGALSDRQLGRLLEEAKRRMPGETAPAA